MNSLYVVFDLDDTLYMERDYVWSGFRVVGEWANRTLGVKDFAARAWALFEQGRRGHIFDDVLTELGLLADQTVILSMVALYRGHLPDICLASDAAECLRSFGGRYRLGLVSDGPAESQKNKIIALGLRECFESVILTSELGEGYAKPHPQAFLHIQKLFDLSPRQHVYVADNPKKDFLGPRSLGWQTIRVRRPKGLYYQLNADNISKADLEVQDLSNLDEVLIRGV